MPRLSRKFKFENVWLKEGQCRVMRRIWVNSSQRPLIEKLQRYAIDIQRWGGGFLPVCRGRMKIFQACLAKLKGRRDVASALQFETIRKELDSAIDQYEQYWKQCATLGHNPNFIWRSLIAAVPILKEGCVLQVGTGNDVAIWEDPWPQT
ncbi:hypothetical protein GH714_002781 [Hevea brasiliensis]|uniref:Uncharacterized protein n=1 Tax=Hevea brasiliensis TaxID=3981 RepID=A0A6A6LY60_HEVBR|nr:hypothetical protein GH714_002781 [Hevea brasiliensis]